MGTPSRTHKLKTGDLVLLEDEQIVAHVYDINLTGQQALVNWTEGPQHTMQKKAMSIAGPPTGWGMVKIDRPPQSTL